MAVTETAAWVERAKAGDELAQAQLFRAWVDMAMRVAMAMTHGERADAEDVVQEAFIACFRRLGDLREGAAFGGFLMTTVKNLGINRWHAARSRKRAAERLAEAAPANDAPADPFAIVAAGERGEILRTTMAALPEGPEKETATLYYLDGLDETDAVAARLGVPRSTVTTRLDRFRQRMRKALLVELARRSARANDRHRPGEVLT